MKKLILCVIAPCIIMAEVLNEFNLSLDYEALSKNQKGLLKSLISKGKKHNLGYSLAAIAWQESSVGKYLFNVNSTKYSYDCGLFQNNTKSVLKREGKKLTKYNAIEACQKLMFDVEFAYDHTIAELKFWEKQYPTDYMRIWKSYNAGYLNVNPYEFHYSKSILNRVLFLQKKVAKGEL